MSRENIQNNQQSCPRAREDNLSTTHVGDETIVYDQLTHKASCLNAVTATAWAACDGESTISDLLETLRKSGFQDASEDIVKLALIELDQAGLLQEPTNSTDSKTHKKSRRDVLRAIGKSAAITIPVISTISIQPAIAGLSDITCSPEGSSCGIAGICVGGICQEP